LDELRQAFVDMTLEVSLHAASKGAVGAAFARATPDKPPGHDAKAKKAAADKRKAAAEAATTTTTTTRTTTTAGIKPIDGAKPSTKK
jgi:predicted aconitase